MAHEAVGVVELHARGREALGDGAAQRGERRGEEAFGVLGIRTVAGRAGGTETLEIGRAAANGRLDDGRRRRHFRRSGRRSGTVLTAVIRAAARGARVRPRVAERRGLLARGRMAASRNTPLPRRQHSDVLWRPSALVLALVFFFFVGGIIGLFSLNQTTQIVKCIPMHTRPFFFFFSHQQHHTKHRAQAHTALSAGAEQAGSEPTCCPAGPHGRRPG